MQCAGYNRYLPINRAARLHLPRTSAGVIRFECSARSEEWFWYNATQAVEGVINAGRSSQRLC